MKNKLIKSLLFIPGHKTVYLKKLKKTIADAFVVDLEDSVPVNKKHIARKNLEEIKKSDFHNNLYVRLNNDPNNLKPDIISCSKAKITSYVLPKINFAKDVKYIEKIIYKHSKFKKLNFFVLIESTKAIINLKEICNSSKNIKGLIFGAEDYLNDLNILEFYTNTNINFPRAIIPIYANAYNLNCIDTPYLNLSNLKEYKNHLKISKNLGYNGILNIHPNQCLIANNNYSPSKSDYKIAKKIISANKNFRYKNQNISVMEKKLVGPPMLKRAQKIIDYFDA